MLVVEGSFWCHLRSSARKRLVAFPGLTPIIIMKTVASYYNMGEAAVALSALEGAGMVAQLENLESSVNLTGGVPAIRLVVNDESYDRACEVIQTTAVRPASPASEN